MNEGSAKPAMLRSQLLWRLLPPVFFVILIASFFAYSLALKLASDAYDAALFDSARSLARQMQASGSRVVVSLPRAAEEILVSDPYDQIFYRVAAADGSTVAGDARLPLPDSPLGEESPVRFYDATIGGQRVRASAYGLFKASAAPAGTVVMFAETLVKRSRLARQVLFALLVPMLLVTFLVSALVWYGVRRGLAPLDKLAAALAKRGWGDLRGVGTADVPGEVRPLIDSLDNLMRRLEQAQSAQQRFISEAAHQLRTPLAALSTQLERALRAQDLEAVKPALAQLQSSSRRVTRLVNQLLTLARAEPGAQLQHEFSRVDLARLVQETCREWVPEALAADVDLGFASDGRPAEVAGHELLLAEMLNNLIDNALRYGARAGQSVTVRLAAAPRVQIAVEDEGPGIPDEERGRVFERFHRLPGSAAGGCGLGLTIVREIARLHGALVSVEAGAAGKGAVFRVVFPDAARK